MNGEGRLPDDDDALDDDFSLEWSGVDDPASEGDDVLDLSDEEADASPAAKDDLAPHDVPWDELAEDSAPQYEEASSFVTTSAHPTGGSSPISASARSVPISSSKPT